MSRVAAIFIVSAVLAGCNPYEPTSGYEYKDCHYTLNKQSDYTAMSGAARLAFIDRCMAEKGLQPATKCVAAQAQGKPHCAYEPAPSKPQFRW